MNAARMVVFILGIALVVAGAWMLFFQAGLSRWIPLGVAGAGLLVLIGLLIVGFADSPSDRSDRTEKVEEHYHH